MRRRVTIPNSQRLRAGKQAAELLSRQPYYQASTGIACYLAQANEFDCQFIIEQIWQDNKQCYLPVLCGEKQKYLKFLRYEQDDQLKPNRYHILEPINTHEIELNNLDLVILPLVGFDHHGNRLGMGGGYYDRTFAFLNHANPPLKPYLMGLAFEEQGCDWLPSDAWDVKIQGVLTQDQVYIFI